MKPMGHLTLQGGVLSSIYWLSLVAGWPKGPVRLPCRTEYRSPFCQIVSSDSHAWYITMHHWTSNSLFQCEEVARTLYMYGSRNVHILMLKITGKVFSCPLSPLLFPLIRQRNPLNDLQLHTQSKADDRTCDHVMQSLYRSVSRVDFILLLGIPNFKSISLCKWGFCDKKKKAVKL